MRSCLPPPADRPPPPGSRRSGSRSGPACSGPVTRCGLRVRVRRRNRHRLGSRRSGGGAAALTILGPGAAGGVHSGGVEAKARPEAGGGVRDFPVAAGARTPTRSEPDSPKPAALHLATSRPLPLPASRRWPPRLVFSPSTLRLGSLTCAHVSSLLHSMPPQRLASSRELSFVICPAVSSR